MRFRRSVAPSPSASHKSHSSEDPARVATPAALRPKPSPPKEEEVSITHTHTHTHYMYAHLYVCIFS